MDYTFPANNHFSLSTYFSKRLLMKQKLFGAAAMVAFILFAASCNEQKQSEFNFDSVTQEVTVSAKVTYDAGVKIDPNNPKSYIIANAEPAQFKKVFISVPYTEYSAGAAAGSKIFEAVTDSAGMFTISIPTKSTGVEATLRLEEFTAVHQEYDKMGDDGKPVFKVKIYTYSTPVLVGGTPQLIPTAPGYVPPHKYKLMPGAFTFPDNNDLVYEGVPVDEEAFDESVTLAGSINLAYETGYHEGAFKAGQDAIVEFVIKYPEWTDPLTFGTTTDQNGNYSVTLPMKSLSQGIAVRSIKVLGVGQNTFKHWTDSTTTMTVAGAYLTDQNTIWEAPAAGPDKQLNGVVSNISYNLGVKNLPFVPYYNGDILANTPQPEGWDPNLIGWAAAKFDESYNKIVTIKGRILMPKNDIYGLGKYEGSRQEIRLTGGELIDPVNIVHAYDNPDPDNPAILRGYTIVTDKNGYFSIDLPVTDETVDQGIIIDPKEANMPFTFTNSKGEQILLTKGNYARDNNKIIRQPEAEWYELGDYYFVYNPDNGEKPDEWNEYLLGWYVNANYKETVDVKGKMLFAYESSYGVGAYQSLNKPVIIEDNTAGDPVRYFAVMPAADGTFDFKLPVKDKTSVRAISVRLTYPVTNDILYPTAEFKHYYKFGESVAPMLLQGHYTQKHHVYTTAQDHTWNNLGTYYMYLAAANVTDIANIPTYHDNLAGWLIVADNNIIRTDHMTGYGYAKFAEETGYMEGAMKPGANKLIPINVPTAAGNTAVYVLTDNTGKFATEIYLKEEGGHPALSVPAVPVPVENFIHYKDAEGNTQTVFGNYNGELIKNKNGEWNDYGTIYYKFTPTNVGTNVPDNWNMAQNIAGWNYKENYEITKTVTGYVKLAKETGYLKGDYQAEKDFPVTVYWDINGNGALNAPDEPVFLGKTDENGKFTIIIPVEKDTDEPKIRLTNLANVDYAPGFLHYVDAKGKTETIAGDYDGTPVKPENAAWNDMGTIYYMFDPGVNPDNWINYAQYIAGWVVKEGYDIQKNVTGYIKLAKETAFLKGSYQTEANTPVKIHLDYNKDGNVDAGEPYLVAPTDANGKFTITVPIKQENDEPKINVQGLGVGNGFDYKEFTHYKDAAGKTETLEGRYDGTQIKSATAEWNDAGTIYYKFVPAPAVNPDNWDYAQYIAGWFVMDGFNADATVTGDIKLAKETGYVKGEYQVAKNQPILIRLDGVAARSFAAAADANGHFAIPVKVQDNIANHAVTFPLIAGGFEEKEFNHYLDATSAPTKIVGTYNGEQVKEPNTKWYETGTIYYKFTPDNITAEWTNFTQYIADWYYRAGYNIVKPIEGSVKVAQETGYLKGDFNKSAKGIPVRFFIDWDADGTYDAGDGDRYFTGSTDNDGKFALNIYLQNASQKPGITYYPQNFTRTDFKHYAEGNSTPVEIAGNYWGTQIKNDIEWFEDGTKYDAGTIYYKFNPTAAPDNWGYAQYIDGWFIRNQYHNFDKKIEGYIKLAKETGFLKGNYQIEKNFPVMIILDLDHSGDYTANEPIFVGPTNAEGKFSINVQTQHDYDKPDIVLLSDAIPNYNSFRHFPDPVSPPTVLTGAYNGVPTIAPADVWDNGLDTIKYQFTPTNPLLVAGWNDYFKYTEGWIYNPGCKVKKTISGQIKLAQESGYLAGDYLAVAQNTPVKVFMDVNGNGAYNEGVDLVYAVPAATDGKFNVHIDVKNETDEPTVGYLLLDIPNNHFRHWLNVNNEKTELTGKYDNTTAVIIKEDGTEWGKLGTVYYKFTPNAPTAFWTKYTQYTAGWFARDGFKVEKIVSGSVKLARETSFWKGDFEGEAKGVPVKIHLNGNTFVSSTTDDGTFNVIVKVKDPDDKPVVTWDPEDLSMDVDLNNRVFVHYYTPGTTANQTVTGKFQVANTIVDPEAAWNVKGIRYYTFDYAGGSTNWTDDLYGWKVWPYDANYKELTVIGAIKKAAEKFPDGDLTASATWVPADYAFATVTVDGNPFRVVTDEEGKFSVKIKKNTIPASLAVTIAPDAINGIQTFKNWTDKSKKTSLENAAGSYTSENNVNGTLVDRDGTTNNYDLTKVSPHSAKMTFTPTPAGWNASDWTSILSE